MGAGETLSKHAILFWENAGALMVPPDGGPPPLPGMQWSQNMISQPTNDPNNIVNMATGFMDNIYQKNIDIPSDKSISHQKDFMARSRVLF